MSAETIEQALVAKGLSYSKEVVSGQAVAFRLPFETPLGIVELRASLLSDLVVTQAFLRSLDGLGAASKKDLYLDLLRLNSSFGVARVLVWRDPVNEVDWLGVAAQAPLTGLTEDSLYSLIMDCAGLAGQAGQAVARHSTPLASMSLTR